MLGVNEENINELKEIVEETTQLIISSQKMIDELDMYIKFGKDETIKGSMKEHINVLKRQIIEIEKVREEALYHSDELKDLHMSNILASFLDTDLD